VNANVPFLIKFNTDLIVGAIIRKAGDAKAQAAKAAEVLAVCQALTQINNGDVTNGLTALDAAISQTATQDPANAAMIQTAIAWLATKASALQQIGSGSILGSLQTDMLNAVMGEASALAQKYIAAAPK